MTHAVARANALRQQLLDLLRTMPYADYLKSDHWAEVSNDARIRGLRRCQLCGASGTLHVHHVGREAYERRGRERAEDLICLCFVCHHEFHHPEE